MDTTKRKQNESEFEYWEELSDGGRRYWFDVKGKVSGFARYTKVVDSEEVTVSFLQEIYNNEGQITHSHENTRLIKDIKNCKHDYETNNSTATFKISEPSNNLACFS